MSDAKELIDLSAAAAIELLGSAYAGQLCQAQSRKFLRGSSNELYLGDIEQQIWYDCKEAFGEDYM